MSRIRHKRVLLFVWTLLLLLQRSAWADEEQEFRQHYEQALSLYEQRDYQAALGEWQKAYAIRQLPRLLLNLGQTYRKLGRAREALGYYELYLRVEPNPEPQLKAELDQYIVQTRVMLKEAETLRQKAKETGAPEPAVSKVAEPPHRPSPGIPAGSPGAVMTQAATPPAVSSAPAASRPAAPRELSAVAPAGSTKTPTQAVVPAVPVPAVATTLPGVSTKPDGRIHQDSGTVGRKRPWVWVTVAAAAAVVSAGVITGVVLGTQGAANNTIPDNIEVHSWSLSGRP